MNRSLVAVVFSIFSSVCFAEPAKSLSIGWHKQGVMFNFMYTGESDIGVFLGFAVSRRNEQDLPTDAYFSWINYSQKDWLTKDAYHGGLAYQVNQNIRCGIGIGSQSTTNYFWGYGVSGLPFRSGTETISSSGPVGLVEITTDSGKGVQILSGNNSVGVAFASKF
jgi:hypothetical protein